MAIRVAFYAYIYIYIYCICTVIIHTVEVVGTRLQRGNRRQRWQQQRAYRMVTLLIIVLVWWREEPLLDQGYYIGGKGKEPVIAVRKARHDARDPHQSSRVVYSVIVGRARTQRVLRVLRPTRRSRRISTTRRCALEREIVGEFARETPRT